MLPLNVREAMGNGVRASVVGKVLIPCFGFAHDALYLLVVANWFMFGMAGRKENKTRIDVITRTQRYPIGVGLVFDVNGRRIVSLELAVPAESLD